MTDQAARSVALRATINAFHYPGTSRPALGGIDLSIRQGEFVIITGPAGAGKTTLCYCLTGVIPKSVNGFFDGRVEVAGRDLANLTLPQVSSLLGLVMQVPENQLFNILVADDVAFGPENLELPVDEVERRLWRYLDFTGTRHLAERFSHLLSGGQSQRVVLSSVLAMEAGMYVFDQPAAELDTVGRRQFYENIARLRQELGKTVVLVEDRLADIVQYADRIILLDKGYLVRDLPPREFFDDFELEQYGIRVPQIITLYRRLREAGFPLGNMPLTPEELESGIREHLPAVSRTRHAATGSSAQETETEPANQEPAIQVRNLSYRYPAGVKALKGIDLEIARGEFLAVVGENGAGKTTLARHLVGLLRPDSGAVHIQGNDIAGLPVHLVSRWVGYLFQDPDYQTFNDSCLAEVAYGLKLRKLPYGEVHDLAMSALKRVGLENSAADHPYTLSRGQRQRLAMAAVLSLQPPILVVDEPSTGLDYRETRDTMELLAGYRRDGGTVLIITHDIEMAIQYARRLIVMAGGRILHDLSTSAVHSYLEELDGAGVVLPDTVRLARMLDLPATVYSSEDFVALLTASGSGQQLLKGGEQSA